MKKLLSILFILPVLLLADRVDDLIQNVPGLEKFPDASAINVFTEITVKVNPDFTSERHIFYVKKILSYEGKKRYSDVILNYCADYETVELGKSFTIDPNKQRIEIPENQVTDLNDQMSIIYPEYINSRQRIINFPKIEPGAFVVLEYTIKSSRKEPVNGVEHFQESNPYLSKSLTIEAPASFKMQYSYPKNKGLAFDSSEKNGTKFYNWSIKNSNLVKEENNSPSLLVNGTPVSYSFYADWQEFGRLKLSKLNGYAKNSQIKELAAKITVNSKNEAEKVLAIYEYMAKEFSLKNSYTSQISFEPQPFDQLIVKKYGSSREMTCLFVSLCRSAGVKDVYPAVILNDKDRFYIEQSKIAVDDFMSEIVVSYKDNILMPGNNHIPFAYAGVNGANVLVGKQKAEILKYQHRHDFLFKGTSIYTFKAQAAEVKTSATFIGSGNQENRDRYQDEPVERRKIWFTQQNGDNSSVIIAGPDFENLEKIDQPLVLNYQRYYADFIANQHNYSYFPLPNLPSTYITSSERTNPYQVESEINAKGSFKIIMENKAVLLSDKNFTREFTQGDKKAFFKQTAKLDGLILNVEREVFIPEMIVSVKNYPAYHKFIQALNNPTDNMIFLQK